VRVTIARSGRGDDGNLVVRGGEEMADDAELITTLVELE
jgi:hypothetical protein